MQPARLLLQVDRTPTPTGNMVVLCDEQGWLRAVDWEDHEARMNRLLRLHYGEGGWHLRPASDPFGLTSALQAYFAGHLGAFDAVRVRTNGTPFQRLVWTALRAIPAGSTTTYGRLAERIGRPSAIRAVGLANGANPIAIAVPCHRVIGANTSLTGYGGGLERKQWLLGHEGARRGSATAEPDLGWFRRAG